MTLYLVQHGKCLSKEVDPQKGLSPEGMAEIEEVGKVVRRHGVTVSRILHSGKKRARQTAEILASFLSPDQQVDAVPGLKPLDDVAAFWKTTEATDQLMLVGHLPFMERLTAYLVTGNVDRLVTKFQNGGIVCLGKGTSDDEWFIRWMLLAHIS